MILVRFIYLIEILGTPGYGRKRSIHASNAGGNDQGVGISTSLSHRADSTPNVKRAVCSLVVDTSFAGTGLEGAGGTTHKFCGGFVCG